MLLSDRAGSGKCVLVGAKIEVHQDHVHRNRFQHLEQSGHGPDLPDDRKVRLALQGADQAKAKYRMIVDDAETDHQAHPLIRMKSRESELLVPDASRNLHLKPVHIVNFSINQRPPEAT